MTNFRTAFRRPILCALSAALLGSAASVASAQSRVHGVIFADLTKQVTSAAPEKETEMREMLEGGTLRPNDLEAFRDFNLADNIIRREELELATPNLSVEALRPNVRDLGTLLDRQDLDISDILVVRPRPSGPGADSFLDNNILLPDIKLQLVEVRSGNIAAETQSTVDGYFDFPEVEEGRYRICMNNNPGWQSSCWPTLVSVDGQGPAYPPPISITPEERNGFRTVAGRVLMEDDSPCRTFDYATGADFTALLRSPSAPVDQIRANSEGYYVLPQVTTATEQVLAQCGGSEADRAIEQIGRMLDRDATALRMFFDEGAVRSVLSGATLDRSVFVSSGSHRVQNLTLPNRRPVAVDIDIETDFGQGVEVVPPGGTVVLSADILDTQPLALFWTATGGDGEASGNVLKLQMPERVGSYQVSVLAGDGLGGWKRLSKTITVTDDNRLSFGGTVIAPGGVNPDDVIATVNGEEMKVGENLTFFGKLRPTDLGRYVVNIDAPGFVPISRVYHRASLGGTYRLQPAKQVTIDSQEPRVLSFDTEGENKLGGRSFVRFAPNGFRNDATGAPYNGPVNVEVAYLNPDNGDMPGDYDGLSLGGEDQALVSFGAVYVGMTDPNGNRLQLRDGFPANLQVELAPNAVSNPALLPATMPVWTYNTETGFWEQEDQQAVRVGLAYRTQMKHFSTVNMDIGTLGDAACVRVQLDFNRTPVDRILKVSTDNGVGGTQTKTVTLDKRLNAVYRLLPLSTTSFEMQRADGTPFTDFQLRDANLDPIPGNTITLQPGEEMQSQVDLWPDEPFDDCARLVVASGDIAEPANFYTRKGADSINPGRAEAYYAFMDPNDDRLTLSDWYEHNGFQPIPEPGGGYSFPPGANVVELAYVNDGDLGSGRKMHCRKDSERVACIVGNYAAEVDINFNRDPASAVAAHDAISGTGFATVGMEYSPIEGFESEGNVVKFFTFGGENRIIAAGLDEGNNLRNHPEVCHVCHGGSFNSDFPNSVAELNNLSTSDMIAQIVHFRDTDPSSFREFDFGAISNLQGNQPENTAKQLNCDYVLDTEPYVAISDLILGWYGEDTPGDCDGTSGAGVNQSVEPVPAGWAGESALYEDVVAKVCRTCHIAQKNLPFTDFASFDAQNANSLYTCLQSMPNAPVTYYRYWIDGFHDEMEARYGPC